MGPRTSCPEQKQVERFLLGEASRAAAASVQAHLQDCAVCRAMMAGLADGESAEPTLNDEATAEETPRAPNRAVAARPTQTIEYVAAAAPEPTQTVQYVPTAAPEPTQTVQYVQAAQVDEAPAGAAGACDKQSPDDSTATVQYQGGDARRPSEQKDTLPATAPVPEGVEVPGYEILQELGRGGMGVVYKARDRRLQRIVALKMVLAGAHAGAVGLSRFRAEAEAVAQLQHPNIVQIYETGEHEGRPFFALEFVEGGSLEQRMQERTLSVQASAELVETLARAIDVAHQRGIVHRDLKPGNILLRQPDERGSNPSILDARTSMVRSRAASALVPKIADFGLAKRVDDDSSQTQSGSIMGTPCYMAPEQAAGRTREIGPAADTYSLGAMLYELLTGRPPFKAGNPIDTIRQVIEQDPVPPRQLEPRVPHDLETICLKCLEKEPARRYHSAGALADDLRCFLHDEPILARPTPAWERAWKWGKRRPAVVALLGVSALAALGMLMFIVWHNVSLRAQLDEARADERLARQREQEALEDQRLERARNEGERLLDHARLAVAARDWPGARLQLNRALATIGSEPRLAALNAPAQTLLKQVEEELRSANDRQASRDRFDQFAKLREQAQFLGTLYTGMDLSANLKATRATVQQALAVYGVTPDKGSGPALDEHLSDAQKGEIREDCYQLLLILAETQAQAATDAKAAAEPLREALRLLDQALRFGAPSRAYHLRRARYLRLLGGDADAAVEAEKSAAAAPLRHVLDHFLIADEFYRRANYEEAIKEFDQVLERKPGHFWAQYLNALCLLRQRRAAEARAQFSACLAQRPDFVWLYLLRGFANGELQALKAADADFEKALRLPLDDYARYVLFVNRGVLRIRQERVDDAVADLNAAIKLKPGEYQAYVNLAQAYRRLKQLDRALDQLDQAVAIEPALAHLYRLRARLQLERQQPDRALADFDQAIALDSASSPYQVDDQVERGRLLLRERKSPEALTAFEIALRLNKDHLPAQRLRAETLFQLGRFREVIEAFDHYLQTGKPLESVYRGRGLARAELGQYPGAIEDFTKALELEPTSAVQMYRGWAYLVCEAPKLALRDFELAIELDPKNGDAYNGRGFVRVSLGRRDEALADADQALRLGPPSPRLLYNAARIKAQCGLANEAQALELIRKALDLLPAEQRAAFWATNIRADSALQSLRRQPRFLRLEVEATQRK
jgi:serine/threonine protein kinase/tetratricopeptide (TPR) repeat protein